ncbi:DUF1990 family protein [Nocardioides montaniterrae]
MSSLTYAEVGATLAPALPPRYRHLSSSRVVEGVSFEAAALRLFSWDVHRAAGLEVPDDQPAATLGADVVMRLSVGLARARVSLPVPCRVVAVVDEVGRAGFAYGTLDGHPERGEELFLLESAGSGVRATVRAFSRPATPLARLAGPAGRRAQDLMTARYLQAMTEPSDLPA